MALKFAWISVAVVIMAIPTANAGPSKIPCPAVSTIQQTVYQFDNYQRNPLGKKNEYAVFAKGPAFHESNMPWYVSVNHIVSDSPDNQIILQAFDAVKKVTFVAEPYASKIGHYYDCLYLGNGRETVSAVGNESLIQ